MSAEPARTPRLRGDLVWHCLSTVVYVLVAMAMTWPLSRDLARGLVGSAIDPWQTLWGFWSFHNALGALRSPFTTVSLWWPLGAPLWFQTWDIPSAVAAALLWNVVPPFVLYNLAVLVTFPLAGFTFYLLARELFGNPLGAVLAGCLFTFSSFHFGHALTNLHIASYEWSPVFFLGLVRSVRHPDRAGGLMLAASGLAIATLASLYHLALCLLTAAILSACAWRTVLRTVMAHEFRRGAFRAALTYSVTAGWLLIGMCLSYARTGYLRLHNPAVLSADMEAFFVPNAVSLWSHFSQHWRRWAVPEWNSDVYVGYALLIIAIVGARTSHIARYFLVVALIGAALSLGPVLHLSGRAYHLPLPYTLLETLVPPVAFSGIPSRFSWMVTFGLSLAAAAALCRLCDRSRLHVVLALACTTIALIEVWPMPFEVRDPFTKVPILDTWASDPSPWAVLDATDRSEALWHQVHHAHPIVAGYVTRVPEAQWASLQSHPLLANILAPQFGFRQGPCPETDARTLAALLMEERIRYVLVKPAQTLPCEKKALTEVYRDQSVLIYTVTRQQDPAPSRAASVVGSMRAVGAEPERRPIELPTN